MQISAPYSNQTRANQTQAEESKAKRTQRNESNLTTAEATSKQVKIGHSPTKNYEIEEKRAMSEDGGNPSFNSIWTAFSSREKKTNKSVVVKVFNCVTVSVRLEKENNAVVMMLKDLLQFYLLAATI